MVAVHGSRRARVLLVLVGVAICLMPSHAASSATRAAVDRGSQPLPAWLQQKWHDEYKRLHMPGSSGVTGASCPSKGDRVPCVSSLRWDYSEEHCHQRGCCYEPGLALDWCFFDSPAGAAANITKVHVVQGCHLDVGFADTAPAIVNRWFDNFFPLAHKIGSELEEMHANGSAALNNTQTRLKFTAQSWLVSLYIDCPEDWEGIHCPTPQALADFHESVAKGWITWHAYPFNTEPEFYDADMFGFGVALTHQVDEALKQPNKTVMSQRDVPGMTRSVIPILRRHGVHTVSVGANGGSTPPNVPQAFVWHDPSSGENVTALYLSGGYGGIDIFQRFGYFVPTVVPGLSEVMVVDWRGDNAGPPPTTGDLISNFVAIQREFPGAEVVASTFDAFAEVLNDALAAGTVTVPTISAEIGDSWVHGTASNPIKHGRTRIAQRLRTECLDSGACSLDDPRVWAFSRLMLKNGEHTWGLDVKSTLQPVAFQRSNWSNPEFEGLRHSNAEYKRLETSWVTQSRWGLDDAVALLGSHPLAATIKQAWATFTDVQFPTLAGMRTIEPGRRTRVGRFIMSFDNATGALSYLEDTSTGVVWADMASDGSVLGLVEYQTYNAGNYSTFMNDYNYIGPLYFFDDLDDFDKVGIATGGASARVIHPTLRGLWTSNTSTTVTVVAEVSMPASVVALAGAAPRMWLTYEVPLASEAAGTISLRLQLANKTATRLPEATFVRFRPCPHAAGRDGGSCAPVVWTMEKLGEQADPLDVVDGGGRHAHVVSQGGVTATASVVAAVPPGAGGTGPTGAPVPARGDKSGGGDPTLTITSNDTGLVCFGAPTGFPTPLDAIPRLDQGVSSQVHSNLWNTNYIMWFGGDVQWQWQLCF